MVMVLKCVSSTRKGSFWANCKKWFLQFLFFFKQNQFNVSIVSEMSVQCKKCQYSVRNVTTVSEISVQCQKCQYSAVLKVLDEGLEGQNCVCMLKVSRPFVSVYNFCILSGMSREYQNNFCKLSLVVCSFWSVYGIVSVWSYSRMFPVSCIPQTVL